MRQMRNRTMKSADLATLRSLHGRKRWEHIWAYYKLPIIGILIVLYIFGYAAYRHFTKKEAVLYVSLVNISAGSDLTGQLTDGFAQYAHLTKKQQVNLLTGLIINETAKEQLGGLHSAKCILYSVDFHEIEECQAKGDWEKSGKILSTEKRSFTWRSKDQRFEERCSADHGGGTFNGREM